MQVQKDFRELLALFVENNVEFVIVGAYALAFHGVPRYTGDLDVLVKPDPQNALRIMSALKSFGFANVGLCEKDFENPDIVIQLGYPPIRIDLITSLTGVEWKEIWANKTAGKFGDLNVFYLGRNELIKNKKALGRKKDLADIEALGEE